MKPKRLNEIILFKTTDESRLMSSRSKSRLRDQLKIINFQERLKTNINQVNQRPYLNMCTMEDPQIRIKRQYSPLYQKSTKQQELFSKGVKKTQNKNMNLKSRILLCDQTHQNQLSTDRSYKTIKKVDPNKQNYNIFDLDKVQEPVTSRSLIKRNPNVQSSYSEIKVQRKNVQDKNRQTNESADYVVKALANYVSNGVKQVHLKFNKKQNIFNKQTNKDKTEQNKYHKRHYSTLGYSNKQNLERRENGICIKQEPNDRKIDFRQDYYRKENRLGLAGDNNLKQKTINVYVNKVNSSASRVGQLRKKFF